LRPDGVFWLNIGDSWAGGKGQSGGPNPKAQAQRNDAGVSINRECDNFGTGQGVTRTLDDRAMLRASGIKPLDMVLIPEQLALALRADGWWLRSILIWAKGVSLSDEYNGNPMPESVNGTRYERHRVPQCPNCKAYSSFYKRVCGVCGWRKPANRGEAEAWRGETGQQEHDASGNFASDSFFVDCPGCPKCEKHDGYVLHKGSWRPTDSYEHILMLTKTSSYFCDREAVLEPHTTKNLEYEMNKKSKWGHKKALTNKPSVADYSGNGNTHSYNPGGRNLRSVLMIPTTGFKGSHFAVFPPRLVEPLIKAATSEKGCCPKCGSPWARVIQKPDVPHDGETDCKNIDEQGNTRRLAVLRQAARERGGEYANQSNTIGWLPTCSCGIQETEPCRVLDNFSGAGTTSLVCERLGLDSIGIDTSAEYIALAEARIAEDEQKRIDEQIKQLRREAKQEAKLASTGAR